MKSLTNTVISSFKTVLQFCLSFGIQAASVCLGWLACITHIGLFVVFVMNITLCVAASMVLPSLVVDCLIGALIISWPAALVFIAFKVRH